MSASAARASGGDTGSEVVDALAEQPGGRVLLELGALRGDVALIGGAVRDVLLGRAPRELDVVVEDRSIEFARELAARLSASADVELRTTEHARFGTALVEWEGGRIDVANQRAESYPAPGALPQVRPGSIAEDLARRDFTVNAIAVGLGGARFGELRFADYALEDLRARRLRVLHERSFIDDPTRLLRLARYRARLGFELDQRTFELAREALTAGALRTVSRARLGAELRLALAETDAVAALAAMSELGILEELERRLRFDEALARRALALLPGDGRPDLALMASLLLALSSGLDGDPEALMFELLDGLEFTAADRECVRSSALAAPGLFRKLSLVAKPSEIHEALSRHTIEAIALAGAFGQGSSSVSAEVEIWFERLRHVHLQIGGEDLLAAGIPAGPGIGRRLSHALARKLDGELDDGREAELRAALEQDAL